MANSVTLPINHVGETVGLPPCDPNQLQLKGIYHMPRIRKILLSMSQLTSTRNYVFVGPNDVKVYQGIKVIRTPIMEGQKLESVCIISV